MLQKRGFIIYIPYNFAEYDAKQSKALVITKVPVCLWPQLAAKFINLDIIIHVDSLNISCMV